MITLIQPNKSDFDQLSLENGTANDQPSMTKQSFTEDADINTIVERFGLTGQLPDGFKAPTYDDFSNVVDFQTALNAVRNAGEQFMAMPAELRAKFDNDPQKLIAFLGSETNRQAAFDMGLVSTPPEDKLTQPDAFKRVSEASKSATADNSTST